MRILYLFQVMNPQKLSIFFLLQSLDNLSNKKTPNKNLKLTYTKNKMWSGIVNFLSLFIFLNMKRQNYFYLKFD